MTDKSQYNPFFNLRLMSFILRTERVVVMNIDKRESAKMFALLKKAQHNAYAPYSNFQVGAAIKTATGKIFLGANIENVSYPLCTCAERAACCAMVMAGERQISEVWIKGGTSDTCPPCGACRQLLHEFSDEKTMVYLCDKNGLSESMRLSDLLPSAFVSNHLDTSTT